jgi:hypothetical protein
MLITICFGFMLLIASLVEFAHCLNADAANAQCPLGEFRCDQLRALALALGSGFHSSRTAVYVSAYPAT